MKRGTITSVTVDKDSNEVRVTVNTGVSQDHRDIPFKMPAIGMFYIPRIGDHVIVYDEGDGKRAAMHPESPSDSAPLPDIGGGDFAISLNDSTNIVVQQDGTVSIDADSIVLGSGGTSLLKDVTVSTTEDIDGHVTSVTLNKTRSNVSETE